MLLPLQQNNLLAPAHEYYDAWGASWGLAWGSVWGHLLTTAASVGGTPDRKKKRRAGWVYNPLPVIEPARGPVEEVEALLLCNAL